jgi:transposase
MSKHEAPARQKNQEVERVRFAGIDIGAERHVVAVVNERDEILSKPVAFEEDAAGYRRLRELHGAPDDCLVAMEATGRYWRNRFGFLVAEGFSVAVINPLRTRRFAEEDLQRTKTDPIDALGIARFAQQKRPCPISFRSRRWPRCAIWCACANRRFSNSAIASASCTAPSIRFFRSSLD